MLSALFNDIQHWYNYTPAPSAAEARRLAEIVGDDRYAQDLLSFGIRPLSELDELPQAHSEGDLSKPFEVLEKHLVKEDVLVDVVTGWRFRYLQRDGGLIFDLTASQNCIDAIELLMFAADRGKDFSFERIKRPTYIQGRSPYILKSSHVRPLTLHVSSRRELRRTVERLTDLFCKKCPRTTKLWFRGQRGEYPFKRSEEISQRLYGIRQEASLVPSAGRFAYNNPDQMGFGISFSGPNHYWKKPFLVWLMRQNARWFAKDTRALDVLTEALVNDDDMVFSSVLASIQMGGGSMFPTLGRDVSWPDEADDLRQWFFAFMKPHSLGVTLQQYGYVTSLLDVTDDLDVAVYFSQATMMDGHIQKLDPQPGRLIYVFAERRTADFFRHGNQLFWGDADWVGALPPRLAKQKAGFMMGSTCRTQNLYSQMVVARIFLDGDYVQTRLRDEDLFPSREDDLLYSTLFDSRPVLQGLY